MNLYQVRIRPTNRVDAAEQVARDLRNWKMVNDSVHVTIEAPSFIEAVHDALNKCEGECYYAVKL